MDKVKGFKTIAFGVLTAVLAVFSSPEMQAFFAEHMKVIGGSVGTIIVVLRALTDSPMFKKAPE
ncbi:hypothetical protein LCGC14_1722990 [marine sediment metagenome]|uniref:Holin n=1 Tax=marine sediment metagenome TaxID=412755 RepID=A0A0F9KBJ4_9ZZZZ